MEVILRWWRLSDAVVLSQILNNRKILDNLRDGLPYPYTLRDARWYIDSMLGSDKDDVFAYEVIIFYKEKQLWNKNLENCYLVR